MHLALQTIPGAIVSLSFGNKVVLYCIDGTDHGCSAAYIMMLYDWRECVMSVLSTTKTFLVQLY